MLSEESLFEMAANKSFNTIYEFYTNYLFPLEHLLREMMRNYISRHLMCTSEDNPKEVDIVIDHDNCSLSMLEMPHVKKMWQDDIIWLVEDSDDIPKELDDYSIFEQLGICEYFAHNG